MGGGDNGCGRELLRITSNNSQTEQSSPKGRMLFRLANVAPSEECNYRIHLIFDSVSLLLVYHSILFLNRYVWGY